MEADVPGPLLDHCQRSLRAWEDAGMLALGEGWVQKEAASERNILICSI